MFKVLVLAAQDNVSDARMTLLIRGRLGWLPFLWRPLSPALVVVARGKCA